MPPSAAIEYPTEVIAALRNEPVQARSAARLTALLDAAADIVAEIGFERLTTALVAERAGASIGTVYRYFPDRIAVIQSLAARNLDRIVGSIVAAVEDPAHSDWANALSAGFAVYVDAFRHEPGFRSLRLGDVIDLGPIDSPRSYNEIVANNLMDALVSRFGIQDSPHTRFVFDTAIEVSDALAARAFRHDPEGDERFLRACEYAVYLMLRDELGDVLPPAGR